MNMPTKHLTAGQLAFFKKLLAFRGKRGVPPTVREMQEFAGFRSPRSVTQFLEALEKAGYVRRGEGARNIRILKTHDSSPRQGHARTVPVPLVGTVAAGLPILATENIEATIPVSDQLAKGHHRYFLLRVSGDSMNLAGIQNGDLVLVRQQATAQPGQNVVALIDDEATVKRLRVTPHAVVLEPVSTNSKYQPIIVDRDFTIQGVVVGTIPAA
jgi:repressor LexA